MKLAGEAITLFNSKLDTAKGYDILYGTVITGVAWYGSKSAGMTTHGYRQSNTITVRIPMDAETGGKSYVDPMTYEAATHALGIYTLKADDIIVRGVVPTSGMTRKSLLDSNYEVMTVMTVTDDRRAPNAPHWKLTGV